jgi:large conductance mechanosensitive channel
MADAKNEAQPNETSSKRSYEVTINVPPLKVPKALQGFADFMRGNGVIAIAVGLFIGSSLKSVLDAFTVGIVNPILGVLTGNYNLSSMSVCINHVNGVCKSNLNYGIVISALISFVIAAFLIYLIIRLLRLDKFDRPKE